jgi:hypothetical protein
MTRFLQSLACLLNWHDPIRSGNGLTCLACGMVRDVLQQPVIIGPAHRPEPVRGVPVTRVTSLRKVSG